MASQPAKRQRANTKGDSKPLRSAKEYKDIIETFDEKTVRHLLLEAAALSTQVRKRIIARREATLNEERTKVINFNHLSKMVWHELLSGYGQRSSRQYFSGMDSAFAVQETIRQIRKETPAHSSFGTKKSALVMLRKIGKSLIFRIADIDQFSHEIRNSLEIQDNPHERAMLDI